MESHLPDENATNDFAATLARGITGPSVFALYGDLGAGKTSFARAFIRTLCGDAHMDVPSPTFTLVQNYDCAAGVIWHFDLYRLKTPDDVLELGWDDAIAEGICLIEWPDRAGVNLPPRRTDIHIRLGQGTERWIEVIKHDE